MKDLFFKHSLCIATDIGEAIECRAGEVLAGVPDDLAARLLRRPDVDLADPKSEGRRFEFALPRRVDEALAAIISPALDPDRLAEDEERAFKAEQARKARADRLKREAGERKRVDA